MSISPDDKYEAATAANWLIKCMEGGNNCNHCPYGDTDGDCLEKLHTTAAGLLRKLAGLRK